MDLSQAEPFDGSAGSSKGFQKVLEASIVDIHTVQKVYTGATKVMFVLKPTNGI